MWLTENPWPGVLLFLIVGSLVLARAFRSGLKRYWISAAILLSLSAGAYLLERAIVTPAEEVEQRVYQVVQACIDGENEQVLEAISARQTMIRNMAQAGLNMADIHEDMHVSDLSVEMTAKGSRALSHFRANGTISVKRLSQSRRTPTRWELTWQKENDEWKIVDVTRLDPINGQEISVLSPNRN